MDKKQSTYLFNQLEYFRQEVEGVECWSARDLQKVFDYTEWRNFERAIKKAIIACENASQEVSDHFVETNKMVELGTGAQRKVKDYALTRYACYLIAQNGDPNKKEIAFAQTYFAIQTRKQELIEQRLLETERIIARDKLTETEKVLSELVHQRNANFALIRAMGDKALFGGHTTQQMKDKLSVPKGRPLADYLQTSLIKGKDFAASLTNDAIQAKSLESSDDISQEHQTNNSEVRGVFLRRGIKPEELPPAEDLKKVKRRISSDEKKLTRKRKDK